ncbi:undecaprenyl-diphosphate phosphatase [bacterium]|nr:undecaprenyl-diphosphate phosphatase [bacterium]MCB2202223.1 undecaprenyl-diphosphate phosphatase [bacterium]
MTLFDSIILGILQGLTEFLPVSSSGHLVLAQALLGVKEPGVSFEVLAHLGTLLSVLVYFRARIFKLVQSLYTPSMKVERKVILFLIIGTIPAGIVGVLLKDFFESLFSEPLITSVMLLVTGCILLTTRFVPKGEKPVAASSSILMGIGQALAIMPGISRSGSTIAVGMIAGVKPSEAAEFSFLLAIPAIGGAAILSFGDLLAADNTHMLHYLVGAAAAFVTGLAAVYGVLATIRRGAFDWFAYYCFAAGLLGLYLFW